MVDRRVRLRHVRAVGDQHADERLAQPGGGRGAEPNTGRLDAGGDRVAEGGLTLLLSGEVGVPDVVERPRVDRAVLLVEGRRERRVRHVDGAELHQRRLQRGPRDAQPWLVEGDPVPDRQHVLGRARHSRHVGAADAAGQLPSGGLARGEREGQEDRLLGRGALLGELVGQVEPGHAVVQLDRGADPVHALALQLHDQLLAHGRARDLLDDGAPADGAVAEQRAVLRTDMSRHVVEMGGGGVLVVDVLTEAGRGLAVDEFPARALVEDRADVALAHVVRDAVELVLDHAVPVELDRLGRLCLAGNDVDAGVAVARNVRHDGVHVPPDRPGRPVRRVHQLLVVRQRPPGPRVDQRDRHVRAHHVARQERAHDVGTGPGGRVEDGEGGQRAALGAPLRQRRGEPAGRGVQQVARVVLG